MTRILIIAACLCGGGATLFSQGQNAPTPQSQQQPATAEKNPFEPIPPLSPPATGPGMIEGVDFRGSRRIPQNALRNMVFSRVGDAYSADTVRRDVTALRNTGRFEDVRVSTEEGKKGGVVLLFVVVERPPAQ